MTPQQLKNSILQLAIQGKLVEQRPEEGTGEELYQQIQAEKQRLIKAGKLKKEKPLPEIKEEEVPFDVPEGWKWTRMGYLTTYSQPKGKISPSSMLPDMWSLDLEDIEKESGRIIKRTKVSDKKIGGDRVLFRSNQVLYSKLRPYLKKMLVVREDGICSSEIVPFDTFKGLNPQYLIQVLKTPYVDNIVNSASYGVKMPRVSTETMVRLLIPLPPIHEQQRIVARIEELLPLVDAYEQAWTKLEAMNKRFPEDLQKAILQQAIQGKLVEQRAEEGTAEELYKQIQAEKQRLIKAGQIKKEKPLPPISEEEIPFEIPGEWKWVRLNDIGVWGAGSTPSRTNPKYYGGSIPWLKTGDLNDGFIYEVPEFVTELALNETSLRLNPVGTILIAMYGATIGKLGILNIEATTNQACCACVPYIGTNYLYLFYYLMANRMRFIKMGEGGAQPNISKEKIIRFLFCLPPLAEQERIVKRIEELLPLTKSLALIKEK